MSRRLLCATLAKPSQFKQSQLPLYMPPYSSLTFHEKLLCIDKQDKNNCGAKRSKVVLYIFFVLISLHCLCKKCDDYANLQ